MSSKVSIALATCNGARYLPDLLNSILHQDYMPSELVICDDVSEDETLNILESFIQQAPFTVRVYRNKTRLGVVENFSQIISICRNEYIVLADQDDIWRADKLALIVNTLTKPGCMAVFSDANLVAEDLNPMGYTMWQRTSFNENEQKVVKEGRAFEVLLKHRIVTGATLGFKKDLCELILPIPENWPHDAWIAMVAAANGKLWTISEPLIDYRQHEGNVTGGKKKTFFEEIRAALRINRSNWYKNEIANLHELNKRLNSMSDTAQAQELLVEKISHLEARAGLPISRWRRLPGVLREISAGRYARFSRNKGSIAIDLLIK